MKCCSCTSEIPLRDKPPKQSNNLKHLKLTDKENLYYSQLYINYQRFYEFAEKETVKRSKFPKLIGLLGTDIAISFAERIFDTFSKDTLCITLPEYLDYINIYHHGDDHERCKITFCFMDVNKKGRVNYADFKSYLLLVLSAIEKVHPGLEGFA